MLGFGAEKGVADAQVVMTAELEETLTNVVRIPRAKVAKAGRPGVVIGTHSSIEVTKDVECIFGSNLLDSSAVFVIELVFDFR